MSASRQRSIGYRFCKGFSLKANRTTTICQTVHGRATPPCFTKFLMQPENQNGATTVCHHPPPTSRQNRRSGIDARPTRSVTTPIQHTKRQPETSISRFQAAYWFTQLLRQIHILGLMRCPQRNQRHHAVHRQIRAHAKNAVVQVQLNRHHRSNGCAHNRRQVICQRRA